MKTKFNLLFFLLISFGMFAQDIVVNGNITSSEDGLPLPGVNVIVQGTTKGTSSDFDGNYSISVTQGEVLEFSYVGFKPQTITVAAQSIINVALETDTQSLEEVVVIGYGAQKKADLTGAITTVKSEEIQKTPTSNVTQALQGKIAGVQVTSAGQPGEVANVKLRGVNSYYGNQNPLYVVDGMWYDNIDFLSPSDVESVNVLKDASSTAIFGVKGAGGVIIIETKSGGLDKKPVFTYDGYTGMQYAQNVLKMANAEQFVTMAYESGSQADIDAVLAAMQRYGRSRVNPNVPDVNTDWYDEILRPGVIMNHNLSFTGGSDKISYSVGANYFSQEGLLQVAKNEYERFNIRSKIEAKFSDRFKIGGNLIFSNATQYNAENSVWNQAYFAIPIMPVYDPNNTFADPIPYANAKDLGYRGTQNPFPTLKFNNNRVKERRVLSNIFAEYYLIPEKLAFKTSYNGAYRPSDGRFMNLPYVLGIETDVNSALSVSNNTYFDQIWDNTLTYTNSFGDHNLTLLGGTSYRDEAWDYSGGYGANLNNPYDEDFWYLVNADPDTYTASSNANRQYAMSYFTRAQYNYKDKYLFNATYRVEGNSKYTKKRWEQFYGFGAGWVLSEEDFMKDNNVFDFLKVRAAYGINGNDKVPSSDGSNEVNVVSVAIDDTLTNGTTVTSTYTDFKWEIIEESNFGVSARMFDNKLSLEADYYIRDTKEMVIPVYQPILSYYIGQNVGEMRNQGLEVALNWSNRVSDKLSYRVGLNFATLKNEVTDIYGQDYIDGGSAEFRQRTMVGEPIQAFYGYEIAGVYQNQAEIDADPIALDNGLQPGDFKFVDLNGDGVIDGDDRKVIGSYLPDFTYGANLGITYGNFDLSVDVYGQSGNQILNRKRGEIIWTPDQNMDADLAINRWHGEGTSNSYPSSSGLRRGWNQKMSKFFVEDGDFFRIQNIQLSYNLNGKKLLGTNMPDTKIILTAERPFTSFNYNGFNPEVNNGIDTQTYPVPAVYTLGLNIKI